MACFSSVPRARLALVTGPPGAGKTTAVREWISSAGVRAAWLTLDTDHDNPSGFWRAVLASLRDAAPVTAAPVRGWRAESVRLTDTVARALAEVETLDEDLVLVLDDFQMVNNRAVLDELRQLLERKPGALGVVVITRSDPVLPLARWRVRDELVEIREVDLRFRPDEARAYLATFEDIRLDERAVTTLERRTEGWIAGLQLAVISLRSSEQHEAFIDSFSGTDRFIADFLVDELLARQPADVRAFLLETSVLPRFDAALCEAATGRRDAEAQLRRLENANLFLGRVDAAGTTFRYHTLFRELLVFELENTAPRRAREIRERAARHLARTGDAHTAVGLFVDAGADGAAFSLAIPHQPELDVRARAAASASLDLIPPAFVAGDRERTLVYADALRKVGRLDDSALWLERASAAIGPAHADDRDRARSEALWSAWYQAEGDAHMAIRHGDRARQLSTPDQRRDDRLLAAVGLHLARAWILLGNPDGARRALTELPGRADDPLTDEIAVPAVLARIEAHEGRLRDAEVHAERALRVAAALDVEGSPATLDALLARARVRWERDDVAGAAADVDEVVALAAELSSRPYLLLARLEEVRVVETDRGPAAARDLLGSIRAAYGDPLPLSLADAVNRLDAEVSIRRGDLDRATRLAATLPVGLVRELLMAAIEITGHDLARARERLDQLDPVHVAHRVRVELLRGIAADDLVELRRHVAVAAELAAPEGFRRVFVENGPAVLQAVRSLATCARLDPVTEDLVEAVVDLPVLRSGRRLVEPLSEREKSVLRYFPTSLSYQDIATELLISVNTLKTHAKSIQRKLGVSSRTEAVHEAERIGMLSRSTTTRTVAG